MIGRRTFLAGLGASLATRLPVAAASGAQEVSGVAPEGTSASLLDAARQLAARPYVAPARILPPPFAGLNYNAYRGIRPRPGEAAFLPQGDGFEVDFLPPGLYFPDPVRIEREVDGRLSELPFSPSLFTFEPRYFDGVPETSAGAGFSGAGFSGLRLRHPLNAPGQMDEVAVFQGASYFRAIGQGMAYGLSARAVALGTGGPIAEEFPRFSHLRLFEGDDGAIRLEGMIDSPSLAGHMELVLTPGAQTTTDIVVTLFPRVRIDTIGIAPLTSMYLKGPMHGAVSDDFRPRVHDSDILMIENGAGERLWRPVANPTNVETSSFADTGPVSFGLYQTQRRYEAFEDTESRYQDRPSAVVTPRGDWGEGAVMLVEIPTGDEFLDNIVAFWRPAAALEPGREHRFAYQLTWTSEPPEQVGRAAITQGRSGREHDQPGTRRFVVDFAGTIDGLTPDLSASGSDNEVLSGTSFFTLPDGRGTRVTFLVTPGDAEALELRLVLRDGSGVPASPVWLHRWTRMRDGGV